MVLAFHAPHLGVMLELGASMSGRSTMEAMVMTLLLEDVVKRCVDPLRLSTKRIRHFLGIR